MYICVLSVAWLLLAYRIESAPSAVALGGIFNALSSDEAVQFHHSQYLSSFLMAVREINNKTDGINDDLLPDTQLQVIVRHADSAIELSHHAVSITETDRLRGTDIGVSAVLSTIEPTRHDDALLSDIIAQSETVHVLTRQRHPDISFNAMNSHPFDVNVAPDMTFQSLVWQSMMCQYGYTGVSIFYLDTMYGRENLDMLMNENYCPATTVTMHVIQPSQTDFTAEIVEASSALTTVIFLLLDVDTAAPLLHQAYRYGLIRSGHQIALSNDLYASELWRHVSGDIEVRALLRGAIAIDYAPEKSLSSTAGLAFKERFLLQQDTLINGVCDSSLDDSDGTHYLYRNEDGSLCAGLNYTSLDSSNLAPNIGLVYDGVIALAMGLHQLLYVDNETDVAPSSFLAAIANVSSFEGASGDFDVTTTGDDSSHGLIRRTGFIYNVYGFNADVYDASSGENGFVYVADWNSKRLAYPCSVANDANCYAHVYNTPDGTMPPTDNRYTQAKLPHVLKIGAMFNIFDTAGNVKEDSVQQLAAFLMAVREINDKTDGIADDLLPYTKIVVSVRSSHDLAQLQQEVIAAATFDFGTGVDIFVNRLELYETMATYAVQGSLYRVVSHFGVNSYLLENDLIAPYKVQPAHSSTLYGSALQSLICDQFGYRKIALFVTNHPAYLNAQVELLSGEFCEFVVISYHLLEINDDNNMYKRHASRAKATGARVFVLLTGPETTLRLTEAAVDVGLFGANRQVFVHARAFDALDQVPQLANEAFHGFIGIREAPNYRLNTSDMGRAFVSRWKEQPATNGEYVDGVLQCDESRDDNDNTLLYRSPPSFTGDITCAGLNFSTFANDASDILPYVAHSYDTAMLLAHGYHKLIYQFGIPLDNPFIIYEAMMKYVMFEGVSGHVKMYDDSETPEILGKGTRRAGEYFEVLNFVRSTRQSDGRYAGRPQVNHIGVWELGATYSSCDPSTIRNCSKPVYYSNSGLPPPETRPPKIIKHNGGGMKACSVILAILAVSGLCLYSRVNRFCIRRGYCGMLPVVCVGALAVSARMWLFTQDFTGAICAARMVLYYISITLFFGPIALSAICRFYAPSSPHPSLLRWKIIETIAVIASLIASLVFVLNPKHAGIDYFEVHKNNQSIKYPMCVQPSEAINGLMIPHLAVLVYGIYCAHRAKDRHDPINEIRTAYVLLLIFVGVTIIVFPMWLLMDIPADSLLPIVEYNVGVIYILCLVLLLLNKLFTLYLDDDDEEDKVNLSLEQIMDANAKSSIGVLMSALNREMRVQLCQIQIGEWMRMMTMHQATMYSESQQSPNRSQEHSFVALPFSSDRRSNYASQSQYEKDPDLDIIPEENGGELTARSKSAVDKCDKTMQ